MENQFCRTAGAKLREYMIVTAGTLIMACGIYFFKFPNNFSTGGVSGLATIFGALIPSVSKGTIVSVVNYALLLLGFMIFGKKFAIKTVYSSVLLSVAISVLEKCIPMSQPLTDQKLAELVVSVGLCAVGSALVFSQRASTGGTDIVAMILKKYTALNIGKALFCSDAVIAVSATFVFDIETGIFSVLGLLMKALLVDNVIDGMYESKCVTIITDMPDEICNFIKNELHRGATVSDCSGAYTNEPKRMILTVLSRSEAFRLKDYVHEIDRHPFVIIHNSSDIVGKGFRTTVN